MLQLHYKIASENVNNVHQNELVVEVKYCHVTLKVSTRFYCRQHYFVRRHLVNVMITSINSQCLYHIKFFSRIYLKNVDVYTFLPPIVLLCIRHCWIIYTQKNTTVTKQELYTHLLVCFHFLFCVVFLFM